MNEPPASHRPQWHLVEVKGTLKELPHTDPRVERGLPEEIESKLSLWEEQVPEVRGKDGVNACQDQQEVVLEHVDGVLRSITVVRVRRDELKLDFPFEGDGSSL